MAAEDENATEDEAQALERLLEEEAEGEEAEAEGEEGGKSKKKLFIIAGGAVLLIGGVVGFLLMGSGEEAPPPSLEEIAKPVEEPEKAEDPKEAKKIAEAPNFYELEPFFLPLVEKKEETGKFVHVRVHLQMSNAKLNEEIENVLPLIRQTIFEILERKRPRDYLNPKKPIKERLKSEIVTSTNTLLVTGSGKINDVYFSEFIVR